MTINFSETFDKVRECFTSTSVSSKLVPKLQSVTIIRDVAGKIRLFLEPLKTSSIQEADTTELNDLLKKELGSYYGLDIWLPAGEQDGYKALIETITNERVFASWDDESVAPRWYILERHVAKLAWTNKKVSNPPWTPKVVYEGHKPAIVSFFSFKGGAGRTTTLVATALTLARKGYRVAIVDLDLEAPGLTTIFSANPSSLGVIDYLVEKKVQEKDCWKHSTDLLTVSDETLLGNEGETLQLLGAGNVDENYLEKLARLDFQNLVDGEVRHSIREMLIELQSHAKPLDFILMDARAGFHDLGGLAISELSHGVVIFGTQSRQSWAGLTHVIRHLATSGVEDRLPMILVHSMAPGLGISGRIKELQEFKDNAYTIFQNNYYSEEETVPNSQDDDAPFIPFVIPYQDSLRGDIALFAHEESPEESTRLSDLVEIMTNSPYRDIAEKLCLLFRRD